MEKVQVSKIKKEEILQLQEIGRQTFYETFSQSNCWTKWRKRRIYFAKIDEKIIGYLKLNFGQSQTELKDDKAIEIERIYVLKEFHGNKVGQILYDKAIEVARQKNADYVWLGVWEENPRAINFYKKNGFVEFDKHIFKLGEDEQTDIMMKLKLTNWNKGSR